MSSEFIIGTILTAFGALIIILLKNILTEIEQNRYRQLQYEEKQSDKWEIIYKYINELEDHNRRIKIVEEDMKQLSKEHYSYCEKYCKVHS
jgi:hypothetical protein